MWEFPIPCGGCVTCLLERSRQHAVRCMHEREMVDSACFITLTYDEECLPYAGSLVPEHLQGFMRRVRKEFKERVRFLACGEYGEHFGRPHYHGILFGVDFSSDRCASGRRHGEDVFRSPTLERLWPMGRSELGSAGFASAAYVAGYVSKKVGSVSLGGREREFLRMSLKPGLGIPWLERNYREVYARDSVIVDGVETRPPRRYDLWYQARFPLAFEDIQNRRVEGRLAAARDPELTESRLAQCEEVSLAKVNLFAREVAA